jgi:hypothetical protein
VLINGAVVGDVVAGQRGVGADVREQVQHAVIGAGRFQPQRADHGEHRRPVVAEMPGDQRDMVVTVIGGDLEIGSGDALIHTMRLVAAALCGMATAAHTSANPHRGPGEAAQAGQALAKAMGALEQAATDVHRHRAIGDLMGMTDYTRRRKTP